MRLRILALMEKLPGYGADCYTERAKEKMKKA